uniref:Uncharacterized protein n=1 Tax=Glossina palpalis gambiensis TaxID=67801 RepID=A0A1B0C396_9MUSC
MLFNKFLPDLPTDIVCTAVVGDSVLSVGRAAGGTGNGLTVDVVVKSQHSRSGNSLQRTSCKAPKIANHMLRQQERIFKFFILNRVMTLPVMTTMQTQRNVQMLTNNSCCCVKNGGDDGCGGGGGGGGGGAAVDDETRGPQATLTPQPMLLLS